MTIKQTMAAAALTAILGIAACSKTPGPDNNNNGQSSLFGNYDQTAMLTNIGNNVLLSGINNAVTSATTAQVAIAAFAAAPNNGTLTAAQTAWAILAQNWAVVEPFGFGPMQDNLISANTNTWPANPTKIESAITANSNAVNVGADTKGLKGLEYLLFDKSGDNVVLTKYTGGNAAARIAFLNSVAKDVVTQATNLKNAWKSGYLTTFENAKGNDVSSSASQLINTLSLFLDQVKNMKVGNPIGMGVKVNDNKAHPELIEYTIAEQSIPAMKANVQAMKAAFDGGSGQGLDDLLNYVKAQKNGQNLSVVVDAQFDDVISKINAINAPYSTAVSSQTQQLQAVFNSLKTLIAYFKVDVANNLGVTITFSDTDGD
jgi:predicted lipoprotein